MTESERTGTFLVTAADDASAVLRDVHSGQVHTLSSNPGVDVEETVRGTVAPDPPMNVSWRLVDVETRWTVSIERSSESPTAHSRDLVADRDPGDLVTADRAGTGEIHVLSVPEDGTERAVEDVLADRESLLARASRLGVNRVEVRSDPGVVSVRYVP